MDKSLKENIFTNFILLNIPKRDYVFFGSATMFALGIRPWEDFGDLDVLITEKVYSKLKNNYHFSYDEGWNCYYTKLFDETIELYTGITPNLFPSIEQIIENGIEIEGYNYMSLDDLVKWKKANGREKDLKHIQMIEEWRKNNG